MKVNDYIELSHSKEGRKIIMNIDEKRLEEILLRREREGFYSTETLELDPEIIKEAFDEILKEKKKRL